MTETSLYAYDLHTTQKKPGSKLGLNPFLKKRDACARQRASALTCSPTCMSVNAECGGSMI